MSSSFLTKIFHIFYRWLKKRLHTKISFLDCLEGSYNDPRCCVVWCGGLVVFLPIIVPLQIYLGCGNSFKDSKCVWDLYSANVSQYKINLWQLKHWQIKHQCLTTFLTMIRKEKCYQRQILDFIVLHFSVNDV